MDSIATAEITPFVPGAGPPPTRIPILFIAIRSPVQSSTALRLLSAEMAESIDELGGGQTCRIGEFLSPPRVDEVLGAKPDHVFASHAVAFSFNVDHSNPGLAGLGLADLGKRERDQPPALNAD